MKKYIKESSLINVCTFNGNKYDTNAHLKQISHVHVQFHAY